MKWTLITIFLCIYLTSAQDVQEKKVVLRRATRQVLRSMLDQMIKQLESIIIYNCNKHKILSDNEEQDLKDTFDKINVCMQTSPIYVTPKEDFLSKADNCSQDSIKKVKNCLADNQQYYPDFLLSMFKSLVTFLYDDKTLITDITIKNCTTSLGNYSVLSSYVDCIRKTAIETHDDENIPSSDVELCKRLVPAMRCYPDTLRDICKSKKEEKYLNDFTEAFQRVCVLPL